jgi:hypothetical protein
MALKERGIRDVKVIARMDYGKQGHPGKRQKNISAHSNTNPASRKCEFKTAQNSKKLTSH